MKREYSWGIVGALALAATAGLSFQGGGSRPKEGASAQTERRAGANTGHPPITESSEELACDDIAKALRLFLNVDKSNLPLPDSCFPQKTNLKKTNPQKTNAQELNLQDRNPPKPTAPKPTPRQKVAPPKADETLHLKFVIATLPDPVHTHLPLVFDRLTEVIQEGAQDDQYSYESSWMPWEDKEDRHARLADDDVSTDRREKREAQPGILLFRRIE